MNRTHFSTLGALALGCALLAASPASRADDGKELVKEHGCFTCHAMQGPKVGPSFADINAKGAGQADIQGVWAKAMMHGESGTFGQMPMPASSDLSDADARAIAAWIATVGK